MIRKYTSDSCTIISKQSLTKQNYLIFKAFDGRDDGLNCLRYDAIKYATMEKFRIKNLTLTFILYVIGILSFQAQDYKRTSVWYFGQNAGLDFNTSPPTPLTDGQINTIEGCATICDTNGNLLLYTDGRTVWNRNHQVIENGTGLFGDASSTQAALIVPMPSNDSLYFVFTTDAIVGNDGLTYSLVNTNCNDGKGCVLDKNIKLLSPVGEKLTAVKHINQKHYWIATHEMGTNRFFSFLITEQGIIDCPIISSIGSVHGGISQNAIGAFKFSPNGQKAALCLFVSGIVELFDFNNLTGHFSNPIKITDLVTPSSLEFSRNSDYLYINERDRFLIQYKVMSNLDSVNNSRYIIHGPEYDALYNIQLALDNKIYSALKDSSFLPFITFPDREKKSIKFEYHGQDITRNSLYGLPNFVSSFFYQPKADFSYDLDCRTNRSKFYAHDTIEATTYNWKISKADTQTFTGNPLIFQFSDTGAYAVELLAINGSDTARQVKSIYIPQPYNLNLGKHRGLCAGESLVLDAGSGQHCYSWNTGSTSSEITIDTAGIYNVKVVSNGFCTFYDTVKVRLIQALDSSVSILRSGDTLFASGNFHKYRWYRNNLLIQDSSVYFLLLTVPGTYKVIGADSLDCFEVNSIDIMIDTLTHLYPVSATPFLIYPNPAIGGRALSISSDQIPIKNIALYNIEGKKVTAILLPDNIFLYELKNLEKGIYILNINQISNYKIIIH